MGLDTVALLVEVEAYFGVKFSRKQAEGIYTVSDMTETVAVLLLVQQEGKAIQTNLLQQLTAAIKEVSTTAAAIEPNLPVHSYIHIADEAQWQKLRQAISLNMSIPPSALTQQGILYCPATVSVGQLVDIVAASAYTYLLNTQPISSRYEIYIAIMGILMEKFGIDGHYIGPGKSFTDDLGLD
jgi:acyl carrier protein